MADYETEEQQVEALKAWWAENGKSVIAGVVIGLGIIFGWRGWQSHQVDYSRESASAYFEFREAVKANAEEKIQSQFALLQSDYADTPYGVLAALQVAKNSVEKDAFDQASEALAWANEHTEDADVKSIIGLRLARLNLQQGKLDEALAALPADDVAGQFLAMSSEVKGDIYLAQGKADEALNAYKTAKEQRSPLADPQLLEMKYYDLVKTVEGDV